MDDSKIPGLTGWPVEIDSQEYLQQHRILELLNNLTAQVVFNRPSSPEDFMIDQLLQLKKAKSEKRNYPCIFDESNLESVFRMLDPTGRGFITIRQFQEAMKTLGIKDHTRDLPTDKITYDVYLREAKLGLIKSSATVNQAS